MILVVTAGQVPDEPLVERQVEVVDDPSDAAVLLGERAVDAVVLRDGIDAAPDLLARLRDGEFGDRRVPCVVVAGAPGDLPLLAFDQLVAPGDGDGIAEAIGAALAVSDYQRALAEFYRACRERADSGVTDPLEEGQYLRELRSQADERLSGLLDEPATVADLLWTGESAPDFGFGGGAEPTPGERFEGGTGSAPDGGDS